MVTKTNLNLLSQIVNYYINEVYKMTSLLNYFIFIHRYNHAQMLVKHHICLNTINLLENKYNGFSVVILDNFVNDYK